MDTIGGPSMAYGQQNEGTEPYISWNDPLLKKDPTAEEEIEPETSSLVRSDVIIVHSGRL